MLFWTNQNPIGVNAYSNCQFKGNRPINQSYQVPKRRGADRTDLATGDQEVKQMKTSIEEYLRAGCSRTPADVLYTLAESVSESVRRRVAENQSTPKKLLESLSSDLSSEVRAQVAFNSRTSLREKWRLAMDSSPDVRYQIAENPHTDTEILIWLSTDENPYVAQRADQTLQSILNDDTEIQGEANMSAVRIEQTLRRMLHSKDKLNKEDARRLKALILADGYISRSERKVIENAIRHGKLDQDAHADFLELLERKANSVGSQYIA